MHCDAHALHDPLPCVQSLGLTVTFGASKPGVQAIVMTLLCFTFGYMHTIVAPMRAPTAQSLQSVLLFCLGVVALSATPFANALEGAVASPGSTNYDTPSGLLAARCGQAVEGAERMMKTLRSCVQAPGDLAWCKLQQKY